MTQKRRSPIAPRNLIASLPPFAHMDPTAVGSLSLVCEVLHIPSDGLVFEQAEPIGMVHFLVSGKIKRATVLYDKTERVLGFIDPGRSFCLAEALCATHYRSSARAISASVVVAIPLEAFREAVRRDGHLGLYLMENLARAQLASEFDTLSHHSLLASQRVLNYLAHLAGDRLQKAGETTVRLNGSKKSIAAHLDMAPETFSRTLNQLQIDGLIFVAGRDVHLQHAALSADQSLTSEGFPAPLRYSRLEQGGVRTLQPSTIINLCGRLRMLSQRMATAWITTSHSLKTHESQVALRKYRVEFEGLLLKLDTPQFVEPLRARVTAVRDSWAEGRDRLLRFDETIPAAEDVFDFSEHLLKLADDLTSAATHSAGASDHAIVNVAGRNRMLSARIIKLSMFRSFLVFELRIDDLIGEVTKEFSANVERLTAFPDNSPEALAQLDLVLKHWHMLIDRLEQPESGSGSAKSLLKFLDTGDTLLRHVDTLVKVYELLVQRNTHS